MLATNILSRERALGRGEKRPWASASEIIQARSARRAISRCSACIVWYMVLTSGFMILSNFLVFATLRAAGGVGAGRGWKRSFRLARLGTRLPHRTGARRGGRARCYHERRIPSRHRVIHVFVGGFRHN